MRSTTAWRPRTICSGATCQTPSNVGNLQLSQRLKEILRALGHQTDIGSRLKKLKTLCPVLRNLLRSSRRTPQKFAVLLAGRHHARDGFLKFRLLLLAAQAQRK